MELSKEEILEELTAIDDSISAHKSQTEIHNKMLKREEFLKVLVTKELENFK